MDLDDIPQSKTDGFPTGVSEHSYDTVAEIVAFIEGVGLADDIDVTIGDYFQRDDQWVVRVKVGDFDDEECDDETE